MQLLHTKKIRVLLIVIAVVCLLFWYFYYTTGRFISAYSSYAALSLDDENVVNVPAQPDNPVRREMNQMLAEVLSGNLSPAGRLQKAQRGLDLAHQSEHILDPIQDRGGDVDQAIDGMQKSANTLSRFSSFGREEKIVALAKRRADIVSDIRALTIRANFETGKIFQHVIDDKGKLSDAYVTELNAEIPDVEAQFNRRSGLYAELGEVSDSIVKEYLSLSVFGLPIHGK